MFCGLWRVTSHAFDHLVRRNTLILNEVMFL
jgi:hypothetical protein